MTPKIKTINNQRCKEDPLKERDKYLITHAAAFMKEATAIHLSLK